MSSFKGGQASVAAMPRTRPSSLSGAESADLTFGSLPFLGLVLVLSCVIVVTSSTSGFSSSSSMIMGMD